MSDESRSWQYWCLLEVGYLIRRENWQTKQHQEISTNGLMSLRHNVKGFWRTQVRQFISYLHNDAEKGKAVMRCDWRIRTALDGKISRKCIVQGFGRIWNQVALSRLMRLMHK